MAAVCKWNVICSRNWSQGERQQTSLFRMGMSPCQQFSSRDTNTLPPTRVASILFNRNNATLSHERVLIYSSATNLFLFFSATSARHLRANSCWFEIKIPRIHNLITFPRTTTKADGRGQEQTHPTERGEEEISFECHIWFERPKLVATNSSQVDKRPRERDTDNMWPSKLSFDTWDGGKEDDDPFAITEIRSNVDVGADQTTRHLRLRRLRGIASGATRGDRELRQIAIEPLFAFPPQTDEEIARKSINFLSAASPPSRLRLAAAAARTAALQSSEAIIIFADQMSKRCPAINLDSHGSANCVRERGKTSR